MRRNRYPEWDAQIIRLYKAGWTMNEIAEEIQWSRFFVRNRLIHHNIPIRKQRGIRNTPYDEMAKTIFLYRDLKLTCEEVAKTLGLRGPATVARRLQRAGVPRRSKSEAQRLRYERDRDDLS